MPTEAEIANMTHGAPGPTPNPFGQFQSDPNFVNPIQNAPIPAAPVSTTSAPSAIPPLGVPIQAPPPAVPAPIPPQYGTVPALPVPGQIPGQAPARPHAGTGSGPRRPGEAPDTLEADFTKAGAGEKAALGERADTVQTGANNEGQALADQGVERQAQAAELAEKSRQAAEINTKLDQDDERNLAVAKDATIPNFWEGRQGDLAGAAIAVALGGAGRALLGQGQNTALQALNHYADQHMEKEKLRIDNMYKYAQAKGQINDKTRHQLAQQYLDLKDQHTYLLEAMRDRVAKVAAESKGAADAAQIKVLQAGLDKQIINDRIEVRKLRGDLELKKAQTGAARASAAASYANANESNANAALKRAQAASPNAGGKFSGEELKSQGIQTILKDLTQEELYAKNPSLKSAAQAIGVYKTLEQKLSPQDQRALLAARQFINADLRRESGAAIGASEFQSAFSRYFPAPGDTAATIRQKALNRQQSIHSMEIAGGQVRGGNPVQEQAQPQARPPQIKTPDGVVHVLQADGSYT